MQVFGGTKWEFFTAGKRVSPPAGWVGGFGLPPWYGAWWAGLYDGLAADEDHYVGHRSGFGREE